MTGDIAFLYLEFNYQKAFGRNFAVRAGASGGARAGTSPEAILAEGLSSIYGYELGGSAKIVQKRNWQLTGTLDLRSNTLYGVSPGAWVRSVIDQIQDGDSFSSTDTDSLLSSGSNLRALAGLRAAWTPTPCLGISIFFESGLGERFEEGDKNLAVVNTGAAVDFDLNPLNGVPLGFVLSTRYESLSERGDDLGGHVQTLGLGIFYTGRRDFSVGLDNTWGKIARNNVEGNIDSYQGRFILRYDFN